MKALVLGGAGYLGIPLCQRLAECCGSVTCYDNLRHDNFTDLAGIWGSPRFGGRFHFVRGDVRDLETLGRHIGQADIVCNLAAIVGAPACDKSPNEARAVNFEFVQDLCKMLSPAQHLFQFTTNSGYGMTDGTSEVDELSPLNPTSLYGKTKIQAEAVALQRERTTSLRLATVFGVAPRMRYDLLVNDWTEKLTAVKKWPYAGHHIKIYEPNYLRNYVHVRDVAEAVNYLLWSPTGVYNVGNPGANCTKMELARQICDVLGIDSQIHIQVDENGVDMDQRNYKVNNDKLLRTGFRFNRSLRDGIQEVASFAMLASPESIKKGRNA